MTAPLDDWTRSHRAGRPVEEALGSELRVLSVRYAAAADERDPEFSALFVEEATVAVHTASGSNELHGREEISTIPERLGRYDRTRHELGQGRYWRLRGGQIVGEVLCTAHHLREGSNTVMFIRYRDAYAPDSDGRWRIQRRDVFVDWTEVRQVSAERA